MPHHPPGATALLAARTLAPLLALVACAPSDREVAHALLAGDLERAAAYGPWQEQAATALALRARRATLNEEEWRWTLAKAQDHLDKGDAHQAQVATGSGLALAVALGRDPAPFEALAQTALDRCDGPACRAEVHAQLALSTDREGWRLHSGQAREAAALGRYLPGGEGPGRCAGVDRAMAGAALAMAAEEYLAPPDPATLLAGATDRLRRLSADPRVSAALGVGAPLPSAATVDALIAGAVDAGFPEQVAACEAVEGALFALDPYSLAIWPAAMTGWEQHHAGVRVGAGLRLYHQGDSLLVDTPPLGSSAWEAGLHRGDALLGLESEGQVFAVAGSEEADRDRQIEALVQGAPGSSLTVSVLREGARLRFSLTRRATPVERVQGLERGPDNTWRYDLGDGLFYVQIPSFLEDTDVQVTEVLGALPGLRGVLLDLRGNGGGDLSAAVELADAWVAGGPLLQMVGRGAPPPPEDGLVPWNEALTGQLLEGVPVVVLVDHDTASAAEVLAGTLRERAGAVIVGEHTWGKGMAQGLRPHPLGFALQITNGSVTLPSGRPLDRAGDPWGLTPDLLQSATPLEALARTVRHRRAGAVRAYGDGAPVRSFAEDAVALDGLPVLEEDLQLQVGILALEAVLLLLDDR